MLLKVVFYHKELKTFYFIAKCYLKQKIWGFPWWNFCAIFSILTRFWKIFITFDKNMISLKFKKSLKAQMFFYKTKKFFGSKKAQTNLKRISNESRFVLGHPPIRSGAGSFFHQNLMCNILKACQMCYNWCNLMELPFLWTVDVGVNIEMTHFYLPSTEIL